LIILGFFLFFSFLFKKKKVYRASYQTAVRIRDIGTLFDVSDIHSFVINSKDIVFLHQKQEKSHNISRAKAAYGCEICGYELESSKSRLPRKLFCSIACKVEVRFLFLFLFLFLFFFNLWFEFLIGRNN
jgi:hypothetical protein